MQIVVEMILKANSHDKGAKTGGQSMLSRIVYRNVRSVLAAIHFFFIVVLISADAAECGGEISQCVGRDRSICSIVPNNGRFRFECSDSAELRRFTKSNSEIFNSPEGCCLSVNNPAVINGYVSYSVDSLSFIICDEFGKCVTAENQKPSSASCPQLESSSKNSKEALGVLIHVIPAAITIGLAIYFAQGLKAL